jgi:hypothetical protein
VVVTDREPGPDPAGRAADRDLERERDRDVAPAAEQRAEQTAEQPTEQTTRPLTAEPGATPTDGPVAEATPASPASEPDPVDGAPTSPRRRRAGRIRQQDPATTRPRRLSLGEQRAIAVAERREEEAREAEAEEQNARSRKRRRVIVACAIVAVIVLVVVLVNAFGSNDRVVTASCVDDRGVVVDDDYCDGSRPGSYGGPGGLIFLGGNSYRYYYGGTAVPGQVAQGGSTVAPKKADVVTRTGRTIQRGGFGVGGATSGSSKSGTSAGGTSSGTKVGSSSRSSGKSSSRSGGGRRR